MIFLILFFINNIWGIEVSGCVNRSDGRYDVEFNSLFKIKDIGYKKSIDLPYELYEEKRYKNVFIYSKKAYLDIEKAIRDCNFIKNSQRKIPEFRIFDIKRTKKGLRVANAVVSFDNDLNIIFGIVEKKNFYIVFPPRHFEFIDEDFKKEVFNYIIKFWLKENKGE